MQWNSELLGSMVNKSSMETFLWLKTITITTKAAAVAEAIINQAAVRDPTFSTDIHANGSIDVNEKIL